MLFVLSVDCIMTILRPVTDIVDTARYRHHKPPAPAVIKMCSSDKIISLNDPVHRPVPAEEFRAHAQKKPEYAKIFMAWHGRQKESQEKSKVQ